MSKKPFGEDDDDDQLIVNKPKFGLKQLSSEPSMFANMPPKPNQDSFEQKVKGVAEKTSTHKIKAAELATEFKKMMLDKTLEQNKSIFAKEVEREVLSKMVQLAVEINNDPDEQEGMGSLIWITLLFSSCLAQRDKINKCEYLISQLEKKIDSAGLDKPKNSE